MEVAFSLISKILTDIPTYVTAIVVVLTSLGALLMALISFFLLIPGDQPEKSLTWVTDKIKAVIAWLTKFSRK